MPKASPQPGSTWWIWNVFVWLGIGLLSATQNVFVMRSEGMHHNWTALFFDLLIGFVPWAGATPLVLRLGRRFPLVRRRSLWTWLLHFFVCLAIAAVSALWVTALEELTNPWAIEPGPPPFLPLWIDRLNNGVLLSAFLYSAVLAASYILDSRDRFARQQTEAAQLSAQLSAAQLDALRHQIEPHFLFNALNAVTGLVREGRNDAAVSVVAGLSDCLRWVLDASDDQRVSLAQEMDFVQKYLEIQKVRFGSRLRVSIDLPPHLLAAQVPRFVLQPLVENAIKHGLAGRAHGGAISITVRDADGTLTLVVYNDGPRLAERPHDARPGIGLANIQSRLRTLYGDACDFRLRNQEPDGVEASVSLPLDVER